ncbi:MAG: ABC transporter permease [Candidatus Kapabacteria bacterium]|jgi:phospholipid/cholesterol/gamma-HCH transport system permease protein|nr:ABC transporter permease [Candidatus Kapabacteria bacterium]
MSSNANDSSSETASVLDVQHFNAYTYCRVAEEHFTLLHAKTLEPALQQLFADVEAAKHLRLTLDFGALTEYDSYLVVWLQAVKRFCQERGITLDVQNLTDQMRDFIALLEKPLTKKPVEAEVETSWHRYVESIGEATLQVWADARFFIEFLGEFFINVTYLIRAPRSIRWSEFPTQITKSGVGAVPIVALVGFLMGVIVGYQGAMQLAQFGAEIYLADMVAISLARELAPLMTAIIVAGRSGAAFAAEIGTMQVAEELDALTTMGFNPMRFLVMPRVLAVTCVMPFLVLFADIAGMFGGLLIGVGTLQLSVSGYLNETKVALTVAHLSSGLIKSLVLGAVVALVGCMRGFQVRGGAESVGHFTTSAVVSGIFLIILLDAVFTVIFQAIGL